MRFNEISYNSCSQNTDDGEITEDKPVGALPAASVPLMTEFIFSHSTENPSLEAPNSSETESPLLKCASCNVCVHACKCCLNIRDLVLFDKDTADVNLVKRNLV